MLGNQLLVINQVGEMHFMKEPCIVIDAGWILLKTDKKRDIN